MGVKKQRPSSVLIEDKANGPAIIKRMKRVLSGIVAVEPEGGKIARLFATCPEWQAGDWWVARNAAWTEPFLDQLTKFPASAHDDMVDAVSQAAIWIQRSGVGILQYYAEQVNSSGHPDLGGKLHQPASTQINPQHKQSMDFNVWGVG